MSNISKEIGYERDINGYKVGIKWMEVSLHLRSTENVIILLTRKPYYFLIGYYQKRRY